jgi:predicted nucleotidyltransferase
MTPSIVYTYVMERMEKKEKNSQTSVIGIVAEYNPFHNGHALHIARARELLKDQGGEDAPVVVVLSSSFTQRGFPALADKWTRTRMALANGVDLVLELPFIYACNAAQEFARGAVDTLAALKFVTHLSFGMEGFGEKLDTDELPDGLPMEGLENSGTKKTALSTILSTSATSSHLASAIDVIADILIHESPAFKGDLQEKLSQGKSYPKAMAETLEGMFPGSGAFVSMPNNALALSYLLRILEKKHDMKILPVLRQGGGYRNETGGARASAAAIRRNLTDGLQGGRERGPQDGADESWIQKAMPASAFALLEEERQKGRLWTQTGKLWALLQGFLVRSLPEELRGYAGMNEGLENLFLKHWAKATSYEDFIGRCVCARYTRNRLQRQAARCLVGVRRWTALALSRSGPPYIRVLGYNCRGRGLLRLRKQSRHATDAIPAVTRLAAAATPAARTMAALEFRASRLRELLLSRPDLRYEERQKPVILP